eukprot:g29211.t1
MVEGNADRPGPDVVLEVATALAERMGGAAPLAMICLDPQVLEYGRELIDKKESGRISLCQTLEDIFQGRDCKLRIEAGDGSQPSSRAGNALLQRELQRASSPLRVLRIVGENLHLLDARNVSLALEKLAAQPERHDSGRMHLPLRRRAAADVELEEVPSWASGQSEELAKLCSSLSRLRVKEESLWSSVMAEVAQRLSREEFSELDISESFRAMAVAKAALSQSLPYEMADRMQVANWMSPHSSAVVTHAMVTAKHVPSADFLLAVHARCISHALVVALTEEVLRREPVPSTCRAVLWAVARSHTVLDAVDVDVRRLIHEASQGLPQAPSAELAALASAAATAAAAGRVGIDVAQQVVQVAVEEALPKDLGPQHLVVTALSEAQLVRATKAQLKITEECHGATLCSQAVQLSEEDVLLHAICDELLHRPSVSPSCASRIACALAESQHRRLFARLEPILAQKAGHLLPHHQARLAHAAELAFGRTSGSTLSTLSVGFSEIKKCCPVSANLGQNCSRTSDSADVGVIFKERGRNPVPVSLNIYDLGSSGQMSFVNSVLKPFDSGAFHCGIEVYGLEWSYSDIRDVKVDRARTGIFSSWPKHSPGHRFVETVDMGFTTKTEVQVLYIIAQMEANWPINKYNILRKNCCHFADELVKNLGLRGVPQRVLNLSEAGASVIDVAQATCCSRPKVFGACSWACCYGSSPNGRTSIVAASTKEMEFQCSDASSLAHEALIVRPTGVSVWSLRPAKRVWSGLQERTAGATPGKAPNGAAGRKTAPGTTPTAARASGLGGGPQAPQVRKHREAP